MNAHHGLGFVLATVLLAGCSAAPGDATPVESSTAEALSVGTYNCSTLTVASFGAPSDMYNPASASSPSTLYAFLNAALAQSTQDVAHAGSHDYSKTASETLASLTNAQTNLASTMTWLTTEGLNGSNADAAYNIGATMNVIIADLAAAASSASISAIGNYPGAPTANAASYAELYARKAAEIANQAGYHADYCYISPYGREIQNAASFPNMSCTSVP
jgi:hypothetical protein